MRGAYKRPTGMSAHQTKGLSRLLTAQLNLHALASARWGQNKVEAWFVGTVVPTREVQMLVQVDPAGEMRGWCGPRLLERAA